MITLFEKFEEGKMKPYVDFVEKLDIFLKSLIEKKYLFEDDILKNIHVDIRPKKYNIDVRLRYSTDDGWDVTLFTINIFNDEININNTYLKSKNLIDYLLSKLSIYFKESFFGCQIDDSNKLYNVEFDVEEYIIFKDTERFGL